MKEYIIYVHISPSKKVYVGQTCQKPEKRWGKNGRRYLESVHNGWGISAFANVIKKYGWDNIEHKILFKGLTKQEADMIEQDLIFYYKKINMSYNISPGGAAIKPNIYTPEEIAARRKAYKAAYYQKHKADITVKHKEYYETHKEQVLASCKEYALNHKEEAKQWRKNAYYRDIEKSRQRSRENQRAYRMRKLLNTENLYGKN